jgi:hypothetical protein
MNYYDIYVAACILSRRELPSEFIDISDKRHALLIQKPSSVNVCVITDVNNCLYCYVHSS